MNHENDKQQKSLLAEIDGKYLYLNEVAGITKGLSGEDSVKLLKQFARRWVIREMINSQAEAVIQLNNPDIEKKVEEYRKSLIRAEFERNMVEKRLDTLVTDSVRADFYKQNPSLFVLKEHVFRGYFIKIPTNSNDLDKIKKLLAVEDRKDDLLKLCQDDALFFHLNDEIWFSFNDLGLKIPVVEMEMAPIKKDHLVELIDGGYVYFLYIKDFRKSGDIAPLNYVKNDVTKLLLSRRRVQLFHNLEEELYNEGIKNKTFKIY